MGVCGNVCYAVAVVEDSIFSIRMLNYVVCLCKGCDGCCVLCLHCEAWSCRCSCMGGVSVSYVFLGCTCACVCRCDSDVICVGHDLNRYSGWW